MLKRSLIAFATLALLAGSAFGATSLSVTADAAMAGTNFGLEVTFDGAGGIAKVVDDTPADESTYRAQFWIDFSNVTMADSTFFVFQRSTDTDLFRSGHQLLVTRKNNLYRVSGRAGTNNPTAFRITPRLNVTDACGPVHLQIERTQSPTPGVGDGELTITVLDGGTCLADGTFVNTTQFHGNGVNNSNVNIDDLHFGAVGSVSTSTTGDLYLDEFASFRTLSAP